MICHIGYATRTPTGTIRWHQESLNDFGDTWLEELLHLANDWAPNVLQNHLEGGWLHVFIRRDDRSWSQHTAIIGVSKP